MDPLRSELLFCKVESDEGHFLGNWPKLEGERCSPCEEAKDLGLLSKTSPEVVMGDSQGGVVRVVVGRQGRHPGSLCPRHMQLPVG